VNFNTFAGYPPGTLLCEPMELQQWVQADGEIVFDVTFHFKYYSRGWNYFLTKNSLEELISTEISVDGKKYGPVSGTDGVQQYDAFSFAWLFYGYDMSAGILP
jgi:hypothetical protein